MKTNFDKKFFNDKKNAFEKLKKAELKNEADTGILPLLHLINEFNEYYTSSSCFGRILLLELPSIGDKKQARFLGKWHKKITINEITTALKNAKKGQIWLLAQGPIIHLTAKDTKSADWLIKSSISCGFKNSAIRSIGKKIVVEILSTERLDFPIGKNKEIYCSKDHLKLLVNISNEIIKKSIKKIKKLEKKLKKDLSSIKTTNITGIDGRKV